MTAAFGLCTADGFWKDSLTAEMMAEIVCELGPGTALSGFMKRIDKSAQMLNVADVASLEVTVKVLALYVTGEIIRGALDCGGKAGAATPLSGGREADESKLMLRAGESGAALPTAVQDAALNFFAIAHWEAYGKICSWPK